MGTTRTASAQNFLKLCGATLVFVSRQAETMKNNNLHAVLGVALLVSACGINSVRGSGNVATETREVSGISAVRISGTGHLIVDQNGTESLAITADDNLMPLIESDVRGGTLELGSSGFRNLRPSDQILYRLTVKNLNEIGISGAATVQGSGLNTTTLKIDISGAGEINLAGSADSQDIQISGLGQFHGGNLKGRDVSIGISGAGQALVAASETLHAQVSGAGEIEYIGDPSVTSDVSGAGSIKRQ
jgi:hypothetical protein